MALIPNLTFARDSGRQPVNLIDAEVEITDTWSDFSDVVNVKGCKSVIIEVDYDNGDSTSMQIRCLVGGSKTTVDKEFIIETVSSSKVDLQGEVIEAPDEDLKFVREYTLNCGINYVKFQVKDAADGTGQIDAAKISFNLQRL